MPTDEFRAIAEYTYDWESWVSPGGMVLWINPAAERITGYTVEECLALEDYPLPLVHPADRPGVASVLKSAQEGGSGNHFEFRVRRKDGTLRWGAISWQPMSAPGGALLGYRTSVRDIADRKRIEDALRQAMRQAESANRLQSEFLANVSHELKTPLQSILGYAELLLLVDASGPGREYARVIQEQGRALERLVDDLLDHSSLQAGALPFRMETFSAQALLEETLRGLEPLAKKKGLTLTSSLNAHGSITCDPGRIAQVARNLVTNAIKFTEVGQIAVSAHLQEEARLLQIHVDDTGPGVEDPETLFLPFRRGQHETLRPGVGLGLAICRHICRHLGGEVTFSKSQLGGARFSATFATDFDRETAVHRFSGSEGQPEPKSTLPRSLVALAVDDVLPSREFLGEALRSLGQEGHIASSADDGYEQAERLRPDLILVDIQMPEIDGWSAARGLRARLGKRPFLVAMSASGSADDTQRLTQAGFHGFAKKPLSLAALRHLLIEAASHVENYDEKESLFDEARLRELASLGSAAKGLLLDRVRLQVATDLQDALAALRSAKQSELSHIAHQVAGLGGLIGARHMHALALDVETRADAGKISKQRVTDLVRESERVLTALTSLPYFRAEP